MTDAELLARLAALFARFDPVPAGIGRAAVGAGALAGRDSGSLAVVASGGVRGGEHVVGFAGAAGRVDMEIDGDGVTVELTGVASVVGELWVRWPGGARRVDVDDWGRFVASGLPAGPLSLVVCGDAVAVGPWVVG